MSTKKEDTKDRLEDTNEVEPEAVWKPKNERNYTGGLILVVLGVIFLLGEFMPWFNLGRLWPLILVAIGLGIILKSPRS